VKEFPKLNSYNGIFQLTRFVKEGDKVEEFSKICEVQSDKAAVEISSRYEGTIMKLYHETGAIAKVGFPLVDIDTEHPEEVVEIKVATKAKAIEQVQAPIANDREEIFAKAFATPAVRRVAKESNINIDNVRGTGPKGRVLKGDVLDFIQNGSSTPVEIASTITIQHNDEIVPLTTIQKAMFKSMTASLQIPHFGFTDSITLDSTTKFRSEINSYLKTVPGTYTFDRISYMPIFLKALSEALTHFPILNAKVINVDNVPSLQYRSAHNIGIAMDTAQGYFDFNKIIGAECERYPKQIYFGHCCGFRRIESQRKGW
jgi:2-oxoisovalerate dehydrogenase E2 component (dihydrolipoyl transacylase)